MRKPYLFAGVGLLVVAAAIIVTSIGDPVPLKTGSLYPNESSGMVGCYTSGVTGDLVEDSAAGTAIVDAMSGQRVAVTWPVGWTARRGPLGVTVLNQSGSAVARTGTRVNLSGGYWTDGSFLTCGAY